MATLMMSAGGAVAASFIGAIVDRVPRRDPIFWARSKCRSCGISLTATDLIPVVSYLALRGRCRHCGAPIPPDLIALELATVVITACTVALIPAGHVVEAITFTWALIGLSYFDIKHGRLPDLLTLPLLALGLVIAILLEQSFGDRILGAALGFGAPVLTQWSYRALRGKEAFGSGDVNLLGVIGAWTGWQGLSAAVLIASALVLVVVLLGRKFALQRAPVFGPYIATAAWIVFVYQAAMAG